MSSTNGSFNKITRNIKDLNGTKGVRHIWTQHALQEMANDNISKQDVLYVLSRGMVHRVEQNRSEETWNVIGSDSDGRKMEVVVVAYEAAIKIKIITVWKRSLETQGLHTCPDA